MLRLMPQELTLDAAPAGELPRRTLAGTALPYNVDATVSDGTSVRFMPGSLDAGGKMPKLYLNHQADMAIGRVVEMLDTPEAMLFVAKISATPQGDSALTLAVDGVLDAVSVGVEPLEFTLEADTGTMVITKARWQELSLVPFGAFSGATVDRVAASIHQLAETLDTITTEVLTQEISPMSETVETPAVIEAAAPLFAQPRRDTPMPTAAEYISAYLVGGDRFAAMAASVKAAAPSAPFIDTESNPGVLPTPIVAPVYNNFIGSRPTIDALGVKAMPQGGQVFSRPSVTTHNSMAIQSAQNAALQESTMIVTKNNVTKSVYGGYVTISEFDYDVSDPAIISLLLDDMARVYANTTDNVVADALLAACTQTAVLTDPTSPAEWVSDLYAAASTILTNSNGNLPNTLFLSPNMFAFLGALVDTTGRPLFPTIGPMNAYGTSSVGGNAGTAFGLNLVVDRNFASNTVIVGDSSGYEVFEQMKGAITVEVPSTLSRTIAFRGMLASLMIDATKFVSLT